MFHGELLDNNLSVGYVNEGSCAQKNLEPCASRKFMLAQKMSWRSLFEIQLYLHVLRFLEYGIQRLWCPLQAITTVGCVA